MTPILLSRLHFPITTLGPGQRIGIWFQGCSIGCKGCISRDTWNRSTETRTDLATIMKVMRPWLPNADGITISGGEPFEQPEALVELLRKIRSNFAGDVLVYSGLDIDKIHNALEAAHGMIDALITGPYVDTMPQTLPLRGSDNQSLHLLTHLGRERFKSYRTPQSNNQSKALDLMQDSDGQIWMAGIPAREDWKKLSDVISQGGNRGTTSSEPLTARRNLHS